MIKRLLQIWMLTFICLIIFSCEDDALLTPKIEEDECTEGPSYCNLSIPGDKKQFLAYNPERY